MQSRSFPLVVGFTLALAAAQCTGGQSGHEGRGNDGPEQGDDAGSGGAGGRDAGFGNLPNDMLAGAGGPGEPGQDDLDAGLEDSGIGDAGALTAPVPRAPLHNDGVCADSAIVAPIDCLDVCGTLTLCEPEIACDTCLQRCVDSPPTAQGRCLALAIYWIDEEGCKRMVQEYESFSSGYPCPD